MKKILTALTAALLLSAGSSAMAAGTGGFFSTVMSGDFSGAKSGDDATSSHDTENHGMETHGSGDDHGGGSDSDGGGNGGEGDGGESGGDD